MSDFDDDDYGGNEEADMNPSEYLLDDAEPQEDDAEDTDNPQYQGESDEDLLINHQQENFMEDEEAVEARREAADFDALATVNLRKEADGFSVHKMEVDTTGIDLSSTGRAKITTRYLTKYEKARLLGTRALQLSMNAPPLVELRGETEALQIAQRELRERKLPLIVRRYLPDGSYEDWSLNELMID